MNLTDRLYLYTGITLLTITTAYLTAALITGYHP